MSAPIEARTIHSPGNGFLRPVEEAPARTASLIKTDKRVSTLAQIVPTGFHSERVFPKLSIENPRRAKLSVLSNATVVHDAEGTVARLITTYSETGDRTTQYLATEDGYEKFREVITQPDGEKKETVDEAILESITGAWVVVRNTYGTEHMMYMYLKEDVDGLPGLPEDGRALFLRQQVNELERLQRVNGVGEVDGTVRPVKMGLNRTFSVEDPGGRSVYRLHVHAWRNDRNLALEEAIAERNKQEGYDGGISTYLGEDIAYDIVPTVSEYWDSAKIYFDEMGPSIWLPGFTPSHMLNNGKNVDIIEGLMTGIDRATDRQLDRVHRTAYASERSDVVDYVMRASATESYSTAKFEEFFSPRIRENGAPDGKYIEDPAIVRQIDAYHNAGLLRRPAGAATGITFIPEGTALGEAGALISLATIVTVGQGGTFEITDVAQLDRLPEILSPQVVSDKVTGLYEQLVDVPKVVSPPRQADLFTYVPFS